MQHESKHITKLLQRCKKGEQSAQFEIYKLYYKAMFNTSLRILKDSYEAEDVMQESFLSAFDKLGTFKADVTFGAWLKRIVINKSITHLRKNGKREFVSLEVIPDRDEESTQYNDDDYSNKLVAQLLECIKKLKDNYRIALTLNLIEGYDYEEIATIMDISYQNARTTISRAKSKIRELALVHYEG